MRKMTSGPQSTSPGAGTPDQETRRRNPLEKIYDIVTALSMTIGRGPAARAVAAVAALAPADRLVDVGCGPGTAVREAVRRGAHATGVDPSPEMLRLARSISRLQRLADVTWLEGRAENLPLPEGAATVVWSLSSVHHWSDRSAGLREAHRVLEPGGRIVIADRVVRPGARGLAAHGVTLEDAAEMARTAETAGFGDVRTMTRRAGRRELVIVLGTK
jgi:SAM-dependent methyltransferase